MYRRLALLLSLVSCAAPLTEPTCIDLHEVVGRYVRKSYVSKGVMIEQHALASRLRSKKKKPQTSSANTKPATASKTAPISAKKSPSATKPTTSSTQKPASPAKTLSPPKKPATPNKNPASQSQGGASLSVLKPIVVANKRMCRPIASGEVLSAFGTSDGLRKNDGVNFKARLYEDVFSADDGSVMYVGELGGYGKIVIIRHDTSTITSYSHLHDICVKKGQSVQRGDVIGYAGATGDVFDPQLHFEVIINKKNVDPMRYIQ